MTELEERERQRIQAHDPSIDVLWNNRTGRWVCVQDLRCTPRPRWHTTPDKLVGVSGIFKKCQYKVMFVCEEKVAGFEKIPIKPTADYIVARLERDTRRFGDNDAFKKIEESWDIQDAKEAADDEDFRAQELEPVILDVARGRKRTFGDNFAPEGKTDSPKE